MKAVVSISLSLPFVSPSILYPSTSQQVLHVNDQTSEGFIDRLLAIRDDDPVKVMRIVDADNVAELDEPQLLQVFGKEAVWMIECDKPRLRMQGLSFMDLTGREDLFTAKISKCGPTSRTKKRSKKATKGLKIEEMVYNLGNLTSQPVLPLRARRSRWIYDKALERIIVGAHQNSVNYRSPLLPAPGADDDGSGTVTILEAFRALVEAGFKPERPVESHWYVAEEGGLLGRNDIATEYLQYRKEVGAMIQFDMTSYVPKDATPSHSSSLMSTTNWTMALASEYSSSPVAGAKLFAGAGSDHMSWHRAGFPAIFATEGDPFTEFNPYIHTANDSTDLKDSEFSFSMCI